jgi:2-phosphosulfolactate phosphatase
MQFHQISLAGCASATGVVVVIDVLRAFTSAAYALAAGADTIVLVAEVDEAFALRRAQPDALLMGEIGGVAIPGFDFSNSPQHYTGLDLHGRRLIQRTSHGTQGVVRATQASTRLVTSFVVARATAAYLRRLDPPRVTFVVTGWQDDLAAVPADAPDAAHAFPHGITGGTDAAWGDEDAACADYITALLQGDDPDPAPYAARVLDSPTGRLFRDPAYPHYPATDLDYCTRANHFDFALPVHVHAGHLYLRRDPV